MFHYLYITRSPEVAAFVEQAGVTRLFVDLEIHGKVDRQGHLNTVISRHTMEDVTRVKSVLGVADLLVRLNPLHPGSRQEVDDAIEAGADIIMQPMFHTVEEVAEFGRYIDGRVRFMPLVETASALNQIGSISALNCVDEIHIGLNDLHLDLGLEFMFEPVASGLIEQSIETVSKPFGFGGVARVGQGDVPGELVMAEHVRLGSTGVILSRAFHAGADTVEALNDGFSFREELKKLMSERETLLSMDTDSLNAKHLEFQAGVKKILSKKL
ncbi:aldolase [Marinobacter confluentis]|uniref:Aldolase n=1 Tax=Marinobacter confluentis TaxID=1697557 RepID=A0A4Z1C8L5_9GAMM|nr:aldolase [Marinobacter confluentis]